MEKSNPTHSLSLREKLTKYSWSKWKPTYFAKSAEVLSTAFEDGGALTHIEHIAFDVDGTLMDYHGDELPDWVAPMFQELISKKKHISIISNAYGDRVQQLVDIFAEVHPDIIVITPEFVTPEGGDPRDYRKPDPAMFQRLAELTGVGAENTLIVGDQLMKDVVTANTVGAASLVVERFGDGDDKLVARWQRPIEELARSAMGLPRNWEDFPTALTRMPEHESRALRVVTALGRRAASTVLKRS